MNNILKKTLFFSPIAVVIVASIAVPLVLTIRKSETFFTLQLNDNTRESNFDTFFSKDKVNDQKLINEYTTAYNGGINPDKQKCLSILNKVLENYTPTQYGVDVLYSIWCSKFKYNLQDYRLGSSFDVAVRSITIDSSKRVSFSSECTKTNSEIKPGSNILK
jgi:ABC-type sugar transport system permease subunit